MIFNFTLLNSVWINLLFPLKSRRDESREDDDILKKIVSISEDCFDKLDERKR